MPSYTYICNNCSKKFELFSTIANYSEQPACLFCNSHSTSRSYEDDLITLFSSIKKSDSELKTVGDLANRNRDKLSNDEKQNLYQKHNAYKDDTTESKPLPKGMTRLKKEKKIKWT